MKTWFYTYLNARGGLRAGVLQAGDAADCYARLEALGIAPTGLWSLPGPGKGRPLSARVLALVLSRLAQAEAGGIPAAKALETMSLESSGPASAWAGRLAQALGRGRSLADAMAETQALEPALISWVRIGEKQGSLGPTLDEIAAFLRRRDSARRRLRQELAYPCLLLGAVLTLALVLFFIIMPLLARQFTVFDGSLPLMLAIPLTVQEALLRHGRLASLVLLALVLVPLCLPRRRHRDWTSRLPLMRQAAVLRGYVPFARLLGGLLAGGVPVYQALTDVRAYFAAGPLASRLDRVSADCASGVALSQALARSGFVPPLAAQTLIEAERVGRLPQALAQSAQDYETVVLENLSLAMRFIEPAAVLGLGILIFLLACGVFLPVLDAYQLVAEAGL